MTGRYTGFREELHSGYEEAQGSSFRGRITNIEEERKKEGKEDNVTIIRKEDNVIIIRKELEKKEERRRGEGGKREMMDELAVMKP